MKKSVLSLLFLCLVSGLYAQKKIKILISVDMEGLAGVVTEQQLGPSGFEYGRFREFMTNEALAAIEGAKQSGATEIVVVDAHGNGQNLLIEKLPNDVKLIRSWPRKNHMVSGIDDSFDGVMLIGYHSSTTNMEGVRAHTFSSAKLTNVSINEKPVSEGIWAAMVTGHYNVPVILISGDNIATKETKDFVGDMEMAVVKEAYGFHSAKSLTPAAACQVIKEASAKAVKRIKDFKPYKVPTPVTLDVSFKNYRPVELLSYLSIVKRTDSHTIRFVGDDMIKVSDFFIFMEDYNSDLEP
ncbi:MAG: M55 family metallopeptidase [Cyclobacteriaceae bacterium]|nr:M55 family metallopeptidase [Cyclobacteriaceae bacterium]